ncbi:MAG: ATP-binding cassette domain-containing protein [Spirochaetaceae bacterium]|jgi:putative ABC transport system ATP-binding protein|nr:ATP-binding cassette domain-containing protein [Spirochaetaceae bacterium]
MAGLLHPSEGQVVVDEISLYGGLLNSDGLARFRSEYLGFIFQAFNLLPYMSALENVLLPLAPLDINHSEKMQLAKNALDKVDLWDRKDHPPGKLSGGQQQRVAIARALVNQPLILFADEPTGNLDSQTKDEIMQLFNHLNELGHTLIMVTHDDSALTDKDRVLKIKDGVVSGAGVKQ